MTTKRTPRGDDPYEPTPALGSPVIPQTVRFVCPVCTFSVRPEDLDPLLDELCPVCLRRILELLKVPKMRPIPVAHPAETAREARQPLRPRAPENVIETKRIAPRREPRDVDETLARRLGNITLPTRNVSPPTPGPFPEEPS